jgi:hypothetical protein
MKNFDIKWISTVLFIIGGTIVALRLPIMKYGFPMFVAAHAILVYSFYTNHKNTPLLLQNIYFFFLNIAASYIWLF